MSDSASVAIRTNPLERRGQSSPVGATPGFDRPRNWSEMFDFAKRAGEAFIGRSHQWVAGENREDALRIAKQTNDRGMDAILNHLGERLRERVPVEATQREYLWLLRAMQEAGIRGAVSVKPTQFGLLIDRGYALAQLLPVLEEAKAQDRVLWLDMETADTTDDTVWLCERLFERYEKVGICLQANLKRTPRDVERLGKAGIRIRIVKGTYREDAAIAHQSRKDIDRAYLENLEILFAQARNFAVASHDTPMIDRALELARKTPVIFEFNMLYGVRPPLHGEIASKGQRVAEYISYGPKWLPYFGRKWRDRPRNAWAIARAFVSG
jgi:proline dehydrogenase